MSSISNTNPATVTIPNTFPNGTNVILYNTTQMTQIAGMTFTISNASSTGFDLLGLDASGFANPAINAEVSLPEWPKPVQPQYCYITKIDRGLITTLTFSTVHSYIPKQLLKISIPRPFGMQELDQKTIEIDSVTNYTVSTKLESTQFTPFAFPSSNPVSPFPQAYKTMLFATAAPAGSRNEYNLTIIPFQSRST